MSTSFVQFQGSGFWVSDNQLEVWLHLLIDEIDSLDSPPQWLKELRDHWYIQSTSGFHGFISVGLDEFIVFDDRRKQLIIISEAALNKLKKYGLFLTKEELNSMGAGGPGSYFTSDIPVEVFVKVGEYFIKLLHHELTTSAASATI